MGQLASASQIWWTSTFILLAFASYNRSWSYDSCPSGSFALLLKDTQNVKLVNCFFHDNIGTALVVNNTSITLAENEFMHNQCVCGSVSEMCELGCGITALNSNLTFTGITSFLENNQTASYPFDCAGAIWVSASSLHFNGTNNFIGNSANSFWSVGGAIRAGNNSLLSFIGTNNFSHNSADGGSAITTVGTVVLAFSGTNIFFNNSAKVLSGGAIYSLTQEYSYTIITFDGINIFIGNSANNQSGGGIVAIGNTSMSFKGACTFSHNSAGREGGAVFIANNVLLTFNGTSNFIDNSANNGGAIFATVNTSSSFAGTSSFHSNTAIQGGAISANSNSKLTFDGNISFTNNGKNIRDSRGGAMYLASSSTLSVFPDTTVCWENNFANLGGAIYILNSNPLTYCAMTQTALYTPMEECFFQLPGLNIGEPFVIDVQFLFNNNSADTAGSVLYGGVIDNCTLNGLDPYTYATGEVFNMLVQYEIVNKTSIISSDPFHICQCEKNSPNCTKSSKTLQIYPGETVQVSVVTVGQRNGIVPTAVTSRVDRGRLLHYQYVQQTTKICTTLNYTVFSQGDVILEIYPEGPCSTFSNKMLLHLSIRQSCPPGFSLENSSQSCVCEQIFQKYTNHCNITNGSGQIIRGSNDRFWVGYNQSQGLPIINLRCPFDFCVSHRVVFPLNSTQSDMQCAYNRSGLLCGACKKGYSLVLGTSRCKQCTNSHLALLIPFAVMGLALVFLLFVCKLTVAIGTLSGLVFYANIVGVNRTIFLPDALSVFIAWLNLDFGIETCFYDGLDAYSNAWLQFVFPVYLWLLVGLLILISHYSEKFAKKLGTNPVPVLATLILLSYTKILRTLIATAYFTQLEYPMYNRSVWLLDGNIDFLIGKHIPLFFAAVLVFTFLFLPYTFLLLFSQWLQAISHLRLFSWMNSAKLKSFLDSYHAPYKAKHRYWPGLLLAHRFVLLLVFTFNHQQNFSINLIAIIVATGILHLWAWVSGGVYKNWCLDALEGSFMLNLIVLAAATYHVNHSRGDHRAVGYTSVSIALATFIGILVYHIFQQLRYTKMWKRMPKLNLEFKKLNTKQTVDNLNIPLNDLTESERCDQLREPWLEDLLQPTHSSL